MELVALVGLSLGFFTIALWQKKIWIMLGAGISFLVLGAYGLIESETGEAYRLTGIFCIVFSLIVFLYAFFGMREKTEEIPFEEPDNAYARELREESATRREKRKERQSLRRRSRLY